MTAITAEDLRMLAARQTSPCVSIYMPLHRSQPDSKQDPIRLKNLLDGAEEALRTQGMSRGAIGELLNEARALETNALFWRSNGSKGLALLIQPKSLRTIHSHEEFEEFVAAGEQFHLAPLVHAYSEPAQFLVLAVSANDVRLYRADEHSLTPVPLPEAIPKNLHEATKGMEFDKGLQYHTSAAHVAGSGRVGIAHGKGAPKDDQKTLLTEYLRAVMRHLEPVLEKESTPLVLAAVNYIHPIFRDVCRYPHLLPEGVNASPDGGLAESDLHRLAFDVVKPKLHAKMHAARNRYHVLKGTERVAFHIEEILRAEDQGRVEVLFAAHGAHIWGTSDAAANAVDVHREPKAGDVDLLNLAVNQAIAGGGTAYVVDAKDVPSREPAAAILRW